KIKFLSKDIPLIIENGKKDREELQKNLIIERQLLQKLNSIFKIEDYDNLIKELNLKYELKGSKEERYSQAVELGQSIAEKTGRLKEINDKLELIEPTIDSSIEIFNFYF